MTRCLTWISLFMISFSSATGLLAQLTVVSWGGSYTKSQVEAYHKPFTAKTGVAVSSVDYNGGIDAIKAQVESRNVTWDIVDVELSDAVRACDEGLIERIDHSILPDGDDGTAAQSDFLPGALQECAVANTVWSTVFAYDKTKFPEGPKTIADFFDTKKFPGKRGLRKSPRVNLEMALMADGVALDDVYDVLSTSEGVERAFAKLESIKDDVIWWEAGAQPPQMLADGEVVMTTTYNGRMFNAIVKEEKPFEIVWDGQVYDMEFWVIVKGAPNYDSALEFLKFSTDTKRLADQTDYISYGPARKSSEALIKPEILPHLPTSPENFFNPLRNDFRWWADNQEDMNERFGAWLASN